MLVVQRMKYKSQIQRVSGILKIGIQPRNETGKRRGIEESRRLMEHHVISREKVYIDRPCGRLPVGVQVDILYGVEIEVDCWRRLLSALLSHSSSHSSRLTDAANRAVRHQEHIDL